MRAREAILLSVCLAVTPISVASCVGPPALTAKLTAQPDASAYSELGSWFGDHKKYGCAVESYRAGLKLEPGSSRLLYLLGLSLFSSGQAQDAVLPLQQSIQLMPEVLKPHMILALALTQLQRLDEAKGQWEAALQIDPHSTMAIE